MAAPEWLIDKGRALGRPDHPDRVRLALAVDSLPAHWRTALEIYYYEGGSYSDVARHFDLAGRQSGQYRVRRALEELKLALTGSLEEE